MNVFDAIYLNENDPIERSFIAAETALDIAIARANKEYELDSGLISLNNDGLFTEATNENVFVKFVKGIFNAIRNFFSTIGDAISNIFDNRKNLESDEYLKSSNAKIRLDKDIHKLEKVTDEEIRKGNKLLQMASSATGVSDKEIDGWARRAAEKIKEVGPSTIAVGAAVGFNAIIKNIFNKQKKSLDDSESIALNTSNNGDSTKEKQKRKIINHMSNIWHELCATVKSAGSGINKQLKETIDAEKRVFKSKKSTVDNKYDTEKSNFIGGAIDDDEYHTRVKSLSAEESDLKETFKRNIKEAKTKRDQDINALNMMKSIIAALKKRYNRKVMSKKDYEANVELARDYHSQYTNDKIDYKTYIIKVQHLLK